FGETRHPSRGPEPLRIEVDTRIRGRRAGRQRRPRRADVQRAPPLGRIGPPGHLFRNRSARGEPPQHLVDLASSYPSAFRRAINWSTGIAGRVVVRIVPRDASMIAAFAIVSSSGASRMFKKSY